MKKKIFWKVVFFLFAIQLIIDCAGSVTAFPFLHYGMFSESLKSNEKNIQAFEIITNGEKIAAADFGILTWDIIQSPLISFQQQTNTNDFSFDKKAMQQCLKMIGLEKALFAVKNNLDNKPQAGKLFPVWYKSHLSGLLGYKIETLEINVLHYQYTNSRYTLLNKEKWINI